MAASLRSMLRKISISWISSSLASCSRLSKFGQTFPGIVQLVFGIKLESIYILTIRLELLPSRPLRWKSEVSMKANAYRRPQSGL